jgi:adenylylsulfate kinase
MLPGDTMSEGFTLWFTGLSGAGKSTLAHMAAEELRRRGHRVEILVGNEVRTHLSRDLGFSKADRDANIRRIGYVCKLLSRNGVIAITAAISPYRETRDEVRAQHGRFFEVYMKCSLQKLVERDKNGLYTRAMKGEIPFFTGISDPYEEPVNPELVIESDREDADTALARLLSTLERLGYIPPLPAAAVR